MHLIKYQQTLNTCLLGGKGGDGHQLVRYTRHASCQYKENTDTRRSLPNNAEGCRMGANNAEINYFTPIAITDGTGRQKPEGFHIVQVVRNMR